MNIFGRKPVLEALYAGAQITKIYIQFGSHGETIDKIRIVARKKNIAVQELSADKISAFAPQAQTQGVVALRSQLRAYRLDELLLPKDTQPVPRYLALDSIQDPHNVGAIFRTAEAAGVNGIIITKHHSAPINDTVFKTSAGAVDLLKIAYVDNMVNALQYCKDQGYWTVGAVLNADKDHRTIDKNLPLIYIVGNEEKGIRPLVQRHCDFLVTIPMKGKINSLNVSVATGILLFG
jgi:23S rRNA (guanosine2251-2'-O)-methyltransferase